MDKPNTDVFTEISQLQLMAFAARERALQAFDTVLDGIFTRGSIVSVEVWEQVEEAEHTYVESRTALCLRTGQVACSQEIIAAIYL